MKPLLFFLCFLLTTGVFQINAEKIDLVKLQKKEKKRLAALKKKKKKTLSVNNRNLKALIKSRKGSYSFIEVHKKPEERISPDDESLSESEDSNTKTKAYWQDMKFELEREIQNLKMIIKANETEMNRLQRIYIGISMLSMRMKYEREFHLLKKKVAEDKIKLKNLQKDLDGLFERARKAGAPPGWLR